MSYQEPLKKAKGLGSAHDGAHHWWMQRVTALALAPLALWLVFSLARLPEMTFDQVRAWAGTWPVAVALLAFMLAGLYHMQLGLQVIIEDYVHVRWQERALQIAVRLSCFVLALISLLAVFRLAI